MRKPFADYLLGEMARPYTGEKFILVTADMGYGLWDKVREKYPKQFYNVGSAEQLMLGVAAGLAMDGYTPICYSITPFLLYRPFEFIRNFMNHEQLNIKLVGGGRDKDYGYLGFTHWGDEDMDIMRQLPNIRSFKPKDMDMLGRTLNTFLYEEGPCYLNLTK
jgi:transketolase